MEPLATLLILPLTFLAAQLPFTFRRFRSWWPWATGLALALLGTAVIAGLIYLGSAVAGTSGDMKRVHAAWQRALFDAGAGFFIAALLAPSVVALLLYFTEHRWSQVAQRVGAGELIAVHLLVATVTLPLAYMARYDLKSWTRQVQAEREKVTSPPSRPRPEKRP